MYIYIYYPGCFGTNNVTSYTNPLITIQQSPYLSCLIISHQLYSWWFVVIWLCYDDLDLIIFFIFCSLNVFYSLMLKFSHSSTKLRLIEKTRNLTWSEFSPTKSNSISVAGNYTTISVTMNILIILQINERRHKNILGSKSTP